MASKAVAIRRRRSYSFMRRRARTKAKMTIPVGVIAGFMPLAVNTYTHFRSGGIKGAGVEATRIMTGWNQETQKWESWRLRYGLLPMVLGFAVHKFIGGSLGVNRMIAAAGIPLIRI